MSILQSLLASKVVVMIAYGAIGDDKVGHMTTFGFRETDQMSVSFSNSSILNWWFANTQTNTENRELSSLLASNVVFMTTPNFGDTSSPFCQYGLTLIPAWISNHMPGKEWDEITYPFLNFNGATIEV